MPKELRVRKVFKAILARREVRVLLDYPSSSATEKMALILWFPGPRVLRVPPELLAELVAKAPKGTPDHKELPAQSDPLSSS